MMAVARSGGGRSRLGNELRLGLITLVCVMGPIFAGCATDEGPKAFDVDSMVVYPLPPDPARVHFLRSYAGSADFKKKQSSFDEWLLGDQPKPQHFVRKADGVGAWDGKMYVVDQRSKGVFVFDLAGGELRFMGEQGPGRLEKPRGLYIDSEGNKYISDMGRRQVLVFDAQDSFLTAYGVSDAKSSFTPVAAVPLGEEIFVVDIGSHNLAVFDLGTGRFLRTLGTQGSEPGQFVFPYDIARGAKDTVLVTDFLNTRVQQIDREGVVQKTIGQLGRQHGHFVRPKGIDVGPDGVIYVVDAAFEVVQMFNPEGQVLMSFGGPGNQPGDLVLPTAVGTSRDPKTIELLRPYAHPDFEIQYLIFVTNQFGSAKVNIYAFGAFPPGKNPLEGRPIRARSRPTSEPIAPLDEDAEVPPPEPLPTPRPGHPTTQPRAIDPLKPAP